MNLAHVARALIFNLRDASAWTNASADVHPVGAGLLANPPFDPTVRCVRDRVRQQAGSCRFCETLLQVSALRMLSETLKPL